MTTIEEAFFKQLTTSSKRQNDTLIQVLTGNKSVHYVGEEDAFTKLQGYIQTQEDFPLDALKKVVQEAIEGSMMEVFAIIDGSTAFSNNHNIDLVDDSNSPIIDLLEKYCEYRERLKES